MNEIKIGNKVIGKNHPSFIIAEVGPNHNGDIDIAKKIIDVAYEAKVDAIKFHTFESKRYVSKDTPRADYDIKNTGGDIDMFEAQKKFELSKETHIELKKYTEERSRFHFYDCLYFE